MLAHTIALLHGSFLLVDDALLILQFLLRCIPHIITTAAVVVRLQVTALNLSTTATAAASIAVNVLGIIYQVDFALKLHDSQRKSKLL
jgi:hypothetical protein